MKKYIINTTWKEAGDRCLAKLTQCFRLKNKIKLKKKKDNTPRNLNLNKNIQNDEKR